MNKNAIHEELDEYLSSILPNYSSKHRFENEITATFELSGKKVVSSVSYSENENTQELVYFSVELKITDNIKDFFKAIGELNYFKIVKELHLFYEMANEKINGMLFTFSDDFELQSIMLMDQSYDRNKRVFKSEVETMLLTQELNEQDFIDLKIAEHINLEDNFVSDAINLRIPYYDDKTKEIVFFLDQFRKHDLKSLYISKNKAKKDAIDQFINALASTGLDYTNELKYDDTLLVKCHTRSFGYNFRINCICNESIDGFDITFKTEYQNLNNINSFNYLLQITQNDHLYIAFKQLIIKAHELNRPVESINLHLNPDLSFNRIYLNIASSNPIIYNYYALKNTGNSEDILWIKYVYGCHKDLIDAQNFEFLNEANLTESTEDYSNVIKDYQENKDDLMLLIKMRII